MDPIAATDDPKLRCALCEQNPKQRGGAGFCLGCLSTILDLFSAPGRRALRFTLRLAGVYDGQGILP